MRYWWVNQNQTYNSEFAGGYIWSPKRNKNGARNQFYENMRSVAPGDLVFSFRDTLIVSVGTGTSYCYDAPKPKEYGATGANWEQAGWRVDVRYTEVSSPIRPKSYIDRIRPLLPSKYSPLQETGDGLQSVYLAELPEDLARLLMELLREAGNDIQLEPTVHESSHREQVVTAAEDLLESAIEVAPDIGATEKEQVAKARRGQGRFRENVQGVEKGCRLSGVTDTQFLIASHIKPWRTASNQERLDGENGLLLCPNIDFLFDRGFISFADDGTLLVSPVADKSCLRSLGVPVDGPTNAGAFSPKQREYLSYHRLNVFLESGRDE
jgi:putative restriction endonuclease